MQRHIRSVIVTSSAPGVRRRKLLQEGRAGAVDVFFTVFLDDISEVGSAWSTLVALVDDGE